jgi:hypothetical protein
LVVGVVIYKVEKAKWQRKIVDTDAIRDNSQTALPHAQLVDVLV